MVYTGVLALAVSPYLGLLIAQVMGASRGFLSFVDREPLPAQLFSDPYVFASAAMALTVALIIVPVWSAARQSIVSYKQEVSRKHRKPLWQVIPVDLILLVFAGWGYYTLRKQAEAGMVDQTIILNPSLFLIPAILMLGVGLLTLRIFPWIIRLLDRFTSSWSGIAWNMTLKQLHRSPEQYNPQILLIILTLALGIYSSSTARTMDRNFTDRLSYQMGAEVVISETWVETIPPEVLLAAPGEKVEAQEPRFEPPLRRTSLGGERRLLESRSSTGPQAPGDLLTSLPRSRHREDLLDHHINSYLNLLISRPGGVLVEASALERAQLKPGDMISVQLRGVADPLQFQILAPVKYWPTLYPDEGPFVIADIDYVRSVLPIEPYDVWLKLTPDASLTQIVDELRNEGVYVSSVKDLRNMLIEGIRRRGWLYGMLSTGFLVAALITVMGFLLYICPCAAGCSSLAC